MTLTLKRTSGRMSAARVPSLARRRTVIGSCTPRSRIEAQADLTLVAFLTGRRVDEHDIETGQRLAHRTVLEFLIGRIADLQGRLGLAEAVPDGDAHRAADRPGHGGSHAHGRLPGPSRLHRLHRVPDRHERPAREHNPSRPRDGVTSPEMMLSSVVLPQPDEPSSA